MRMNTRNLITLALTAFLFSFHGCGGASGGPGTTVQPPAVQGIAAAGNPITGTVYLSELMSANTISVKTTDAGEFSIDTTGLQAPFILKSVDSSNNEMFSYANGPGTANLNPLTTLAMAVASAPTGSSLSDLYNDHKLYVSYEAITNATAHINTSLDALLRTYCSTTSGLTVDFMAGPYTVNHQGLDDLFDKVLISISTGTVVITRKDDNTNIFIASLSNLLASGNTGTLMQENIPTPAPLAADAKPGNAKLTLRVQGGLPQGTVIKNASFSIQLPLGITVVTPESTDVTLVNYMAIPIGTAAGSNIYPTPTFSPTNNTVSISLSSLTGFSAGDFLTIWYIDSSSYSMYMRTPSDFTISNAAFYSDIYKKQALQNLAIVPVSITFATPTMKPLDFQTTQADR